jgi:hypothetical protein
MHTIRLQFDAIAQGQRCRGPGIACQYLKLISRGPERNFNRFSLGFAGGDSRGGGVTAGGS